MPGLNYIKTNPFLFFIPSLPQWILPSKSFVTWLFARRVAVAAQQMQSLVGGLAYAGAIWSATVFTVQGIGSFQLYVDVT